MFFAMAFLTFFRTISVKIALRIERGLVVQNSPESQVLWKPPRRALSGPRSRAMGGWWPQGARAAVRPPGSILDAMESLV